MGLCCAEGFQESRLGTVCALPVAGDTRTCAHTRTHCCSQNVSGATAFLPAVCLHMLLSHLCSGERGLLAAQYPTPDFLLQCMPPVLLVHVLMLQLTPP